MFGSPRLRPATPDDVGAIAAVHLATWRATYPGLVPADYLASLTEDGMAARRRSSLADPANVDLVGLDAAGAIVGFATGGPAQADTPGYDGELYALYVLPGAQSTGLGRALTVAMATALIARGCRSLLVWVLADNPSCGFYARLGGILVGEKTITLGGAPLREVAYGWPDASALAAS